MIHHERSLNIDASPEAIWSEISRYMNIDEFAPLVTSVDALTDGENGLGSIRRNNFENGTSMVEEVIKWDINRGYRVRASDFDPFPMRELCAELAIKPAGDGKSTVTWSMDFQVKYGPVGWLLGQLVMKRAMGKIIDANLEGLADKVRAG